MGSYFIELYLDGTFNPFPNYVYSGTLRPLYPLSPKRQVPVHIPRPDYAERDDGEPAPIVELLQQTRLRVGVPISEMRTLGHPPRILSPDEIKKMRAACCVSVRVILFVHASLHSPYALSLNYICLRLFSSPAGAGSA